MCFFIEYIYGLFLFFSRPEQEETRSRIFAAPLAGRVLLRNVTAAAEGVYKCEISTEAPYFDTDFEEANLSVIGERTFPASNNPRCIDTDYVCGGAKFYRIDW